VRTADGSFAQFDAPGAGQGGSAGTYVLAINKSGTAAGYLKTSSFNEQAFMRAPDGTIIVFDAPGAGHNSGQGTRSTDINAHGVIAGSVVNAAGRSEGFLRRPNGKISVFDVPNGGSTFPLSINDDGVIAGYFTDSNGTHGFLRTP
jgi:streptogramin lyase